VQLLCSLAALRRLASFIALRFFQSSPSGLRLTTAATVVAGGWLSARCDASVTLVSASTCEGGALVTFSVVIVVVVVVIVAVVVVVVLGGGRVARLFGCCVARLSEVSGS